MYLSATNLRLFRFISLMHILLTIIYLTGFTIYNLQVLKLFYVLSRHLDPYKIKVLQIVTGLFALGMMGGMITLDVLVNRGVQLFPSSVEYTLSVGALILLVIGWSSFIYQTYLCWSFAKKKLAMASNVSEIKRSWFKCTLILTVMMVSSLASQSFNFLANLLVWGRNLHEVFIGLATFMIMIATVFEVRLFENLRSFIILVIQDPHLTTEAERSEKSTALVKIGGWLPRNAVVNPGSTNIMPGRFSLAFQNNYSKDTQPLELKNV
jgi:hypothetical protein